MSGWYILNDRNETVPVTGLDAWAQWASETYRAGRDPRHVAADEIGGVAVSTVFLGWDHRRFGDGPPLLFETMIFGGNQNAKQWRCSTWADAENQHRDACALVRGGAVH